MRKEWILVVLILVTVLAIVVFGGVRVEQVKDLRDFLLQPKSSVYAEYGYSEDTFRLYNMVAAKETLQVYEIRIKVLEGKVARLEGQMAILNPRIVNPDPNEVVE